MDKSSGGACVPCVAVAIVLCVLALGGCGSPSGASSGSSSSGVAPPVVVAPEGSAARETQTGPLLPAEPLPLPASVDGSLPTGFYHELLGRDAGGNLLLAVTAMFETPGGGGGSGRYYVVLDSDTHCVIETLREPEPQPAELSQLRALATRFGLRQIGYALFDARSALGIVSDNGVMYLIDGGHTKEIARQFDTAISPDQRWIAFNGTAPEQTAVARALHTALPRPRYPRGMIHDLAWAPDNTLYFSYDNSTRPLERATRVCIGHLAPSASAAPTEVVCFPSTVNATNIMVVSPSVRFAALETITGGRLSVPPTRPSFAVHVIDLTTGRERLSIPGALTQCAVDDTGRLACAGPAGRPSSDAAIDEVPAGVSVVSFVDDGVLLATRNHQVPETLAQAHCTEYTTIRLGAPADGAPRD